MMEEKEKTFADLLGLLRDTMKRIYRSISDYLSLIHIPDDGVTIVLNIIS